MNIGLKFRVFLVLVFFAAVLFIFFLTPLRSDNKTARIKKVAFSNKNLSIQVELADTPQKHALGLMFRKELLGNSGMLFLFKEEGKYSFWMKNMNFPLDIIWIDKDKKIVDIRKNVPVCRDSCESLIPLVKARYVLEVNAGFVDKYQIKLGDEVNF